MTSAYTEKPEVSKARIMSRMKEVFPWATENQMKKILFFTLLSPLHSGAKKPQPDYITVKWAEQEGMRRQANYGIIEQAKRRE